MTLLLRKIVSGGQTGVDRGALEAALWLGLDHGGWCPRGRRAEDGKIPAKYALQETDSANYTVRTEKNVVDSDGTLILFEGDLNGGSAFTHRMTRKHARPVMLVDLNVPFGAESLSDWLTASAIEVLNVAGPRDSSCPQIGDRARSWLVRSLAPEAPART